MRSPLVILLVIVAIYRVVSVGIPRAPIRITVNFVRQCPGHPNTPATYDNVSLTKDPEDDVLYMSGILNMREDIPVGVKLSIEMRRCYNEKPESCKEKYLQVAIENICDEIPKVDKPWTEFARNIQGLNPHCPLKAGSYKMTEAPIDSRSYANSTEFMGHMQVELALTSAEKMIGCLMCDLVFSTNRGRPKDLA